MDGGVGSNKLLLRRDVFVRVELFGVGDGDGVVGSVLVLREVLVFMEGVVFVGLGGGSVGRGVNWELFARYCTSTRPTPLPSTATVPRIYP